MEDIKKYWLTLALMLYSAFVLLMWKWGHQGDMTFWMDWSKAIFSNGLYNIYQSSNCDYMPAYLYFLWFHTKVQGNLSDIQDNLYTIKYYTFIFDMCGAFLAVWFVKDQVKKVFYFCFLLLNAAYFYNTALWGQVDSIFTFWGFLSLILALERRVVLSCLALLIALNFKLQALIFIPIVGLILLPQVWNSAFLKKLVSVLLLSVALEALILSPFILHGQAHKVWDVITHSVGHYPYPAVGAFNIWHLLLPYTTIEGMFEIDNATKFGLLTYKQTGTLMYFIAMVLTFFPLMKAVFEKLILKKQVVFPLEKFFLIAALSGLSFYFFNTEMHERYAHPAIICLAAFAYLRGNYISLMLTSVAYALNLERICWYLHYHEKNYKRLLIFNPKFIAAIYLIAIIYCFFELYKPSKTELAYEL